MNPVEKSHPIKKRFAITIIVFALFQQTVFAQHILITYYSETGYTKILAEAVAGGARQVDYLEVKLLKIEETTVEDLKWADGIILGSPVHSGNIAAPVMTFFRTWPFEGQVMMDKVGAAFVTGGGISAGEEAAQLSILRSMLVFNMIVVGGPEWTSPFGASGIMGEGQYKNEKAQPVLDQHFLEKGRLLGQRVGELCVRLKK